MLPSCANSGSLMTDDRNLQSRLVFIGIDRATKEALRELRPLISKAVPGLLDQFYKHLAKYPEVAKLFANQAAVQHARQAQIEHWGAIANAKFDDAYLQSVSRVGQTHGKLGIEPRWYIAGYS